MQRFVNFKKYLRIVKKNGKKITKKAFTPEYLLITNVGVSIVLSGVGDVLQQNYEIMTRDLNKWNSIRTINMSISGCTVGVLCHYWYEYLDKILPGRALKTVIKKVILDQFICSPFAISVFFITLAVLEGTPVKEFVEELKKKAWRLYVAEWIIWPPAQFINFYAVPYKYRVFYDNSIALGYDVYTSYVKHDKS